MYTHDEDLEVKEAKENLLWIIKCVQDMKSKMRIYFLFGMAVGLSVSLIITEIAKRYSI